MKNKIETFSELYDLVEQDENKHHLKQITEMFLAAMNDWPTYNQENIEVFINELKEYFGSPLSLEQISSKKLNLEGKNAWRHEAGSSICEMIELSKLYYGEIDFDKIVTNILYYYRDLEKSKH